MKTKLEMIDGKVIIKTEKDGKWITLFTNPKFSLIGHIKKFHYDGDDLVVDDMTVEQLSVVSELAVSEEN